MCNLFPPAAMTATEPRASPRTWMKIPLMFMFSWFYGVKRKVSRQMSNPIQRENRKNINKPAPSRVLHGHGYGRCHDHGHDHGRGRGHDHGRGRDHVSKRVKAKMRQSIGSKKRTTTMLCRWVPYQSYQTKTHKTRSMKNNIYSPPRGHVRGRGRHESVRGRLLQGKRDIIHLYTCPSSHSIIENMGVGWRSRKNSRLM